MRILSIVLCLCCCFVYRSALFALLGVIVCVCVCVCAPSEVIVWPFFIFRMCSGIVVQVVCVPSEDDRLRIGLACVHTSTDRACVGCPEVDLKTSQQTVPSVHWFNAVFLRSAALRATRAAAQPHASSPGRRAARPLAELSLPRASASPWKPERSRPEAQATLPKRTRAKSEPIKHNQNTMKNEATKNDEKRSKTIIQNTSRPDGHQKRSHNGSIVNGSIARPSPATTLLFRGRPLALAWLGQATPAQGHPKPHDPRSLGPESHRTPRPRNTWTLWHRTQDPEPRALERQRPMISGVKNTTILRPQDRRITTLQGTKPEGTHGSRTRGPQDLETPGAQNPRQPETQHGRTQSPRPPGTHDDWSRLATRLQDPSTQPGPKGPKPHREHTKDPRTEGPKKARP